jgi:dihydrofolate reductase
MMKAILACDAFGGIAKDGIMPWPRNMVDLNHFKRLTTDAIVVMGRKTWEAYDMPSPLPNRTNVVVTSNTDYQLNNASVLSDNISSRLTTMAKSNTVFVIGGASLFTQLIDDIHVLHLTRLTSGYDCDTFLPMDKIAAQFELLDSVQVDAETRFETYMTRRIYDLPIRTKL